MRIEPYANFRFAFRGIASKRESFEKLQLFLHKKLWLPANADYGLNLLQYHTDNDGSCDIILKEVKECSLEEASDILFEDLCRNNEVQWVSVLYNKYVDKIVYNNIDKYPNRQKIEIVNLKEGDEVIVYYADNK